MWRSTRRKFSRRGKFCEFVAFSTKLDVGNYAFGSNKSPTSSKFPSFERKTCAILLYTKLKTIKFNTRSGLSSDRVFFCIIISRDSCKRLCVNQRASVKHSSKNRRDRRPRLSWKCDKNKVFLRVAMDSRGRLSLQELFAYLVIARPRFGLCILMHDQSNYKIRWNKFSFLTPQFMNIP